MKQNSIRNNRPDLRVYIHVTPLLAALYRWSNALHRLVRPASIRPTRLNAHLRADIGLRDTRLTRRELAELERNQNRAPGAADPLRHRIWTDFLD